MARTAGALGNRKAAGEEGDAQEAGPGEEEIRAVLEYVVKGLNEELVTELLEGFHCGDEEEGDDEGDGYESVGYESEEYGN
jgi:hypothetical protein